MDKVRSYSQDGPEPGFFIDGLGYHKGRPLEADGWHWVGGPDGGCWHTDPKTWGQALRRCIGKPWLIGVYRWRLTSNGLNLERLEV